ncbi:hypothetical protein JCM6882_009349 [Rhodosporidiobolus microsporus]
MVWKAVVVGGREAVFIEIDLSDTSEPKLKLLASLEPDDFIGDAAFLNNKLILLSTLHNSILVYRLPSPLQNSSSPPSLPSSLPILLTLHAPLRPLLWCSRFSQPNYFSTGRAGEEARGEVRLAGGTMWGDAYLWDVATGEEIVGLLREAEEGGSQEVRQNGGLRRFIGHKGSIFTASYSPLPSAPSSSPARLCTASDDRTLRLFPLPSDFSPTIPLEEGENKPPVIDLGGGGEEVLWGHEGRVWRAEWVDDERIDATLRLWTASPPDPPSPSCPSPSPALSLSHTFRSGHDGRSIWSVAPLIARESEDGGEGVLTGGADGGVRFWGLPPSSRGDAGATEEKGKKLAAVGRGRAAKGEKVKSFAVRALGGGADLVAAVTVDGSLYAFLFGTPSSSSTSLTASLPPPVSLTASLPPPVSLTAPLYASPTSPFSDASTAVTLSFVPVPPSVTADGDEATKLRLLAFSNRGHVLSAVISLPTSPPGAEAVICAESVVVHDLPARATDVALLPSPSPTDGPVRVVIWDRASWGLAVVDLSSANDTTTSPTLLASLPLSTLAPTALSFLTPSLFLVGFADGGVSLFSLPLPSSSSSSPSSPASSPSLQLPPPGQLVLCAHLAGVHADGVTDFAVRRRGAAEGGGEGGKWDVETVGRDGARCVLGVRAGAGGEGGLAVMEKVDERAVVKGSIERILPAERYHALLDGRAVVCSSSSEVLYSFASPGKKIPSQLVDCEGGYRYYRLVSGQLHRESLPPSSASLPPPVLLPALHGREIRDVASLRLRDGRQLLAMGAENGVLTISELTSENDLRKLYRNAHLPAALKSLAWSAAPPSSSSSLETDQESYLLLASGARSLLSAFLVAPTASSVRVIPAGCIFGEGAGGDGDGEGEEVRCMGVAVLGPLGRSGEGRTGVVAVYSDGRVKLWFHLLHPPLSSSSAPCSPSNSSSRTERGSFSLVAASAPAVGEKCVLTVGVASLEIQGEDGKDTKERMVVVTGSSDGLLALRDLTSFLHLPSPLKDDHNRTATPAVLLPPFFTFREAHQSGINALALHVEGSILTIATGGDDNALSVRRLRLALSRSASPRSGGALAARLLNDGEVLRVADAHASTITAKDVFLASSSVDQRLNLWRLCPSSMAETVQQLRDSLRLEPEQEGEGENEEGEAQAEGEGEVELELKLADAVCVDVADCAALEVLEGEGGDGDGKRRLVVVGIGAEVVEVDL